MSYNGQIQIQKIDRYTLDNLGLVAGMYFDIGIGDRIIDWGSE